MFSDELLEKIYSDSEISNVPICNQTTVIYAIERILIENHYHVEKEPGESE